MVVSRELRARPSSVKPMEVAGDVSTLVAQKVLKVALTTALLMVVVSVATMKVVLKLQGENLVSA